MAASTLQPCSSTALQQTPFQLLLTQQASTGQVRQVWDVSLFLWSNTLRQPSQFMTDAHQMPGRRQALL